MKRFAAWTALTLILIIGIHLLAGAQDRIVLRINGDEPSETDLAHPGVTGPYLQAMTITPWYRWVTPAPSFTPVPSFTPSPAPNPCPPEVMFEFILQSCGLGNGSAFPNARGTGAIDLQTARTNSDQVASGIASVISGGSDNKATGLGAIVSGGTENVSSANTTVVSGGASNTASANSSTVSGGSSNTASGVGSVVAGGGGSGVGNTASGIHNVVSGGSENTAGGTEQNTIGGGSGNEITGVRNCTIGGGSGNSATAQNGTIAGGENNIAALDATVGGGFQNESTGDQSTIGGGFDGDASGFAATIGGGASNEGSGDYSAIAGGRGLIADGFGQVVGGHFNVASGNDPNTPSPDDDLWILGNGTGMARSNAIVVHRQGNIEMAAHDLFSNPRANVFQMRTRADHTSPTLAELELDAESPIVGPGSQWRLRFSGKNSANAKHTYSLIAPYVLSKLAGAEHGGVAFFDGDPDFGGIPLMAIDYQGMQSLVPVTAPSYIDQSGAAFENSVVYYGPGGNLTPTDGGNDGEVLVGHGGAPPTFESALDVGSIIADDIEARNSLAIDQQAWQDVTATSGVGFQNWTLATGSFTSVVDGQLAFFRVPYMVGTTLQQLRVKYAGSDASTGVLVTLRKRDESSTTTTFSVIGSQQIMHNNGVIVTAYDFSDEVMSANTSYEIVIESDIAPAQTATLYSVGISTGPRSY